MSSQTRSRVLNFLIAGIITAFAFYSCAPSAENKFDWDKIATLKNPDGSISPGFAGAVNGFLADALLVGGGANFPVKKPWEGGKKFYSKQLHVLRPAASGWEWDTSQVFTLPEPVAYPGIVQIPDGLIYAGGENESGPLRSVYRLSWNENIRDFNFDSLPDLPKALTNLGLALVENQLIAIGGDERLSTSDQVYFLNLDDLASDWETAASLPTPLANALVLTDRNTVYVIGGRSKNPSGISTLNGTVYAYSPGGGASWSRMADVSVDGKAMNLSAAAGVVLSPGRLLVTGGDNGEIFHQIEVLTSQIAAAGTVEKDSLTAAKNKLVTEHKGFYRSLLLFEVDSNQWTKLGELPFPAPVTTRAFRMKEQIILPTGEIRPGIRTPEIWSGTITSRKK